MAVELPLILFKLESAAPGQMPPSPELGKQLMDLNLGTVEEVVKLLPAKADIIRMAWAMRESQMIENLRETTEMLRLVNGESRELLEQRKVAVGAIEPAAMQQAKEAKKRQVLRAAGIVG